MEAAKQNSLDIIEEQQIVAERRKTEYLQQVARTTIDAYGRAMDLDKLINPVPETTKEDLKFIPR